MGEKEPFMFGKMHLLVLHFPIALIFAAVAADLLFLATKRGVFRAAGFYCIVAAGLMAIPTVTTGFVLMDNIEEEHAHMTATQKAEHEHLERQDGMLHDPEIGETLEDMGLIAGCLVFVAGGFRLWRKDQLGKPWGFIYAGLIVAAAVVIGVAAHYGGMFAGLPV
jgi:uncharacterized membrane protein